jgi:glycosyltransferase involved in cell wall biosynthesis
MFVSDSGAMAFTGNGRDMKRPRISAVIMARDEARNIEAAIESLRFAEQIVVADTGSNDNTIELARNAGAEVHSIEFDGFGSSKNRALEFCHGDWIFFLDADERVSEDLARNITSRAANDSEFDGFAVNRLSYFLGKPVRHSGWYPDYVIRLFRKGRGKFSDRLVHEGVELKGTAGKLEGLLYHYSYENLDQYIGKLNVYSRLNAEEMYKNSRKYYFWDSVIHPTATFIKMYIFKAGFLDGFNGFLLAVLSSYHVFVKYAKLRQLHREGEK